MKRTKFLHAVAITLAAGFFACNKTDFLDARPDDKIVVPATVADFQALLDKDQYMNGTSGLGGVVPGLGEVGSDGYYVVTEDLNGWIEPSERNAYSWQKDIYTGETVADWNYPYRAVYYANVALDGIEKITPQPAEQAAWNNVKGSALFYRGHMFYQLAQVFAPAYDAATAGTEQGIPLRLGADVNEVITRALLQETYDQVIKDVTGSIGLLPAVPLYKTRPSRSAAYGLLARIYLTIGDYNKALSYADSCLQLDAALMDFNTLDSNSYTPVPRFNEEVIFHSILVSHTIIIPTVAAIDDDVYNLYGQDDLRKAVLFEPGASGGGLAFTGTYDGSYDLFGGIATDEIYLVKAECLARNNNAVASMQTLNAFLKTRWKAGSFVPYTANNGNEALKLVLEERKKELMFRALRWTDLRRLNKDPEFAKTLKRQPSDQQVYTLAPADPKYVYAIPPDVISFNPHMAQNPR